MRRHHQLRKGGTPTRNVVVIEGDGIGREVVPAALNCLEAVTGSSIEFRGLDISSERYFKSGELVTDGDLEEINSSDAVLFGAIGDPRVPPGIMERGVILRLRAAFDLFLNIRPARSLPFSGRSFSFAIARENTEEFYLGFGGKISNAGDTFNYRSGAWEGSVSVAGSADDDLFYNLGVMSSRNTSRFFRKVSQLAVSSNKTHITVVDKSNAVPGIYQIWRETAKAELSKDGLEPTFMYGDAAAYEMVMDPSRFDLVAAPNLYGDILSDLSSGIMGGLGFAPSGNYGPGRVAIFEPVHGSAPDIAGRGISNPIGAIMSGAMLLEHLGFKRESEELGNAVESAISKGLRTVDMGGNHGTSAVVDRVMAHIG